MQDAPLVTVHNRAELRAWLAANHATSASVWLATPKRHRPDYLPYEDMVQELLCWGWIDSRPRVLGPEFSGHFISPRKRGSVWSAINKAHVARAIAAGAMKEAGLAKIAAAKADGSWDFLNEIDQLIDPPDLTAALAGKAAEVWATFPRSIRHASLGWIKMAKSPATRAARIADVAESAAQGLRPKPFRR